MIEEGEKIGVCTVVLFKYIDKNVKADPINKRHGSVIRPEIKSFFSSLAAQFLIRPALNNKYQIKISDGR